MIRAVLIGLACAVAVPVLLSAALFIVAYLNGGGSDYPRTACSTGEDV